MDTPIITEQRPPSPATDDKDGIKAQRAWKILAASELDAWAILKSKAGVQRGTIFRNANGQQPDLLVKCQRLSAVGKPPAPTGGTGCYEVIADYARDDTANNSQTPYPGGPVVWTVETALITITVDEDVDGNPIAGTSGDPLTPPSSTLESDEVLVARWYQRARTEIEIWQRFRPYRKMLNSTDFQGAPRGSFLCLGVDPMLQTPGWFLNTGKFHFKAPFKKLGKKFEGWDEPRIDRGRRKLVAGAAGGGFPGAAADVETIKDNSGVNLADPVDLDGKGQPLAPGKQKVLLTFKHFKYIDLNNIFR